ncbi:MAG: M15 family metallopeptidase [Deltaproteobacteria bacterium]|nr:M15 family metallopeptidase [Deltaproteobacteria bacterium]
MTKTERRVVFFQKVAQLIRELGIEGHSMMPFCFYRSRAKQLLMRARGLSKVKRSKHQDWLAIDLVLIRHGVPYWSDCPEYTRAGEIWESLGGVWGGRWKDPHDIYHFEEGDWKVSREV